MKARHRMICFGVVLLCLFVCTKSTLATGNDFTCKTDYRVFAYNNLGMHCYDPEYSVFSLLPPFNVLRSQVIYRGPYKPRILDGSSTSVSYMATPDPNQSINTTSCDKTDFWDHIAEIFGVSKPVDTGIMGAKMPGPGNTPQPIQFDSMSTIKWFAASGIPITYWDDAFQVNPYPMMNIQVRDKYRKNLLSSLDVVVPVSSEINCASCHQTGMDAATAPGGADNFHGVTNDMWSTNPDPVGYKENILILHDAMNGTQLMQSKPVLCASCHYSKALDLQNTGPNSTQTPHLALSLALHRHHGLPSGAGANDNQGIIPITDPVPGTPSVSTCYFCHPGTDTQCLRSVMAVKGMTCQNCHGGLTTLGAVDENGNEIKLSSGKTRQPWVDLPKCQSCHTGDAVSNLGGTMVLKQAYADGDPAANPRIAINKRFAENGNSLFQMSAGHKGVACESCHGSTHAEWPARAAGNDDITAIELQGHTGPIIECVTCHKLPLLPNLQGPHGLHPVNDRGWNKTHGFLYLVNKKSCKSCHGQDLSGTILSRTATQRKLIARRTVPVTVPGGTQVSCSLCHTKQVFK